MVSVDQDHDLAMVPVMREAQLGRAFVMLADTLSPDFNLVESLQLLVDTCTEVLDVTAGALFLTGAAEALQVMATTSEDAEVVAVTQIEAQQGPYLDCFAAGTPITAGDLRDTGGRWPAFCSAAVARGFHSVHATPLRYGKEAIGSMTLFGVQPRALSRTDIAVAQTLADVTTVGVLRARRLHDSRALAAQPESALTSRIALEQANGGLSATADLSTAAAFAAIQAYARRSSTPIPEIANRIVDRSSVAIAPDQGSARPSSGDPEATAE